MKNAILPLLIFLSFTVFAQLSPQSKKVTEAFFPDPSIEIKTPAFQKKRGFTDYEELLSFLQSITTANSEIASLSFIGESQKGTKVPFLQLKKNNEEEKLKVWIQGGLHGNEMGSVESSLYIIQQLLENPDYSYLLDRLEIAFVPLANPDGYKKQNRYAANGLDLNRDQTKLNIKESVFLKQTFSDFGAHVALDLHEYKPYRKDFSRMSTYGISSIYDAMFLYSGNLNVPKNLREYTDTVFVEAARKKLDENQLRHHPYISTRKILGDIHFNQGSENSRSSATSYALTNTISTLVEVRGVGIGRTSFKRRVQSAFLISLAFLETAYQNVAEVKKQIEIANNSTDASVALTKKKVYLDSILTIDLDKNEEIKMEVTIRDALQLTPTLIRERPIAYILLPEADKLADKLKILGLQIIELEKETELEVEKYLIENYRRDAEKYEGVNRQEVVAITTLTSKRFPQGSKIVYLDQRKGNMAIEVLEPEVKNSFVSFEVWETEEGAELPYYRYLKQEKIK